MSTATELWQAGDLRGAIAAQEAAVRARPADAAARATLADFLCFAGELERADVLLDALVKLDASAATGVALARQLVRAETARRDLYASGRMPELIEPPAEHVKLCLEASIALRAGRASEAQALCARAEEARPRVAGRTGGLEFDDLRDADDLCAGVLEVLTSTGKLYWIPFDRVESIALAPLERVRDVLWRRASVVVKDGPDGEVWLPAVYAATGSSTRDDLRLARASDWTSDAEAPVRGLGLRTWLLGDEARTLHEVETIELRSARGSGA